MWRGVVLERAVTRLGVRGALASFGAEGMLEHRNFQRMLKRERGRVSALSEWLALSGGRVCGRASRHGSGTLLA